MLCSCDSSAPGQTVQLTHGDAQVWGSLFHIEQVGRDWRCDEMFRCYLALEFGFGFEPYVRLRLFECGCFHARDFTPCAGIWSHPEHELVLLPVIQVIPLHLC
jgi:hypothetical protein